jgi:hypothetical protein
LNNRPGNAFRPLGQGQYSEGYRSGGGVTGTGSVAGGARPYPRNQFPTSYQFLSPGPQFHSSPYQNRAYQPQQLQQRPPQQVGGYQNYSRPNQGQGQAQIPPAGRGQQSGNTGRSMSSNPAMRALRNDLHSVPSRTTITKLNLTVFNIRNKLVLTTVKPRTTRALIRKIITTTLVIKRDSLIGPESDHDDCFTSRHMTACRKK